MNRLFALILVASAVSPSTAFAQNWYRDYVTDVPRPYSPDDPWTRGAVYRAQVGHSGLFFNCDHEEAKRYSPYIEWQMLTPGCRQSWPLINDMRQQCCEVRQRIRWGKGCDVPHYEVPWHPTGSGYIVPADPGQSYAPSDMPAAGETPQPGSAIEQQPATEPGAGAATSPKRRGLLVDLGAREDSLQR